ncbi:MAG: 1-acyl-sn-glycerol-3-phosphate acyltransferase [Rhodobacteraceae bacterium]|jgi:1-acyl-sn-glycerol-3-phosphate acyltransferase|uniref:1-acyl-sn-glycerol-3-phosphate acyltransferase n=1 Tax=Thioclava marina TaxID=1915077 RepID=A0ABX3MP14_9RHOB|nr:MULTISPECIES: 1-acyl-sn-glycerol-3-phosphate acyltransferase [Thioclava]TNE93310.1 MAG: 1-acyl-sn-glycerol-3-phosphate acyltransferase [Paracoccaceae bacterium]MBD3805193.1 1-acyl-sn-glycerol-3-phosphate acyltransferase [Thioclava sp.]OOY13286.1 1-acyl-sn-glycerol-3-phosphate acyltransferase [Thioclava marina]OOY28996.1 1-acyl-sn-glycerol-3-phosphate acyltransferase [Thioclava sp. L04-15]TNF10354.1 MAG: 1-acyl-sn-glycerol-3-phosphate acyltransferase [Paracoccaceae bacterium]
MADKSRLPGKATPVTYVMTALYYVHIALATVLIGAWGLLFQVLPRGREGVHRTASVWTQHLLDMARIYLGLRYELRGTPPTGDCIVAAKHQSFFDILILANHLPRRAFVMKKVLLRVPIMGWFAHKAGCIPIDRSKGSEAMKVMLEAVEEARATHGLGQLIIYPEGTRVPPGERRRYKQGAGVIAEATGLPVVPVATNAGLFWSKRGWPILSGVAVTEFLPPIEPDGNAAAMLKAIEAVVEPQSDALMAEAGFKIG